MRALINTFSGGIVTDPRSTAQGASRVVTNFNTQSNPHTLTPYRSSESGDSSASTSQKQNFCLGLFLPGSTNAIRLFSLGVQSGNSKAEVLAKSLGVGGSTDLSDATWITPVNNQSSGGAADFNLFVYYKKTGYIYGIQGPRYIWRFDPTSGGAFVDTHVDLGAGIVNTAQGVVHSKDDILYIPYDNKIASNDNGSWNNTALTLPSDCYITSICESDNFLKIATAPLTTGGDSHVYFWDRDSSLTTIDENVNWGKGILKVLEDINGYTVGISIDGGTSTTFKDRIIFKYYTGAGAKNFFELIGTTGSTLLLAKQKLNNRIYFMMSITLNGAIREGVWSFGMNAQGNFTLVHERTPNNDTAIGNGALKNFFYVGDFLFQSYVLNSAVNALSKTDDSATYSATSIYESLVNPGMPEGDKMLKKQLKTIAIPYTTLSGVAGQVVVKYKVDGGSFTTVGTAIVTGTQTVEYTLDATGSAFTAGRDYEFRLESTLGCEINGATYTYELLETLIK